MYRFWKLNLIYFVSKYKLYNKLFMHVHNKLIILNLKKYIKLINIYYISNSNIIHFYLIIIVFLLYLLLLFISYIFIFYVILKLLSLLYLLFIFIKWFFGSLKFSLSILHYYLFSLKNFLGFILFFSFLYNSS